MPHRLLQLIRVGMTLLLLAFFFQYEFMQIAAWANMIRDYSQNSTLKLAVSETFSGEKPCEMCKQLIRSQTGASKDSEMNTSTSLPPELAAPESLHLPFPASGENVIVSELYLFFKQISLSPPVPPPRFFLG